jgi:hypothetical protein
VILPAGDTAFRAAESGCASTEGGGSPFRSATGSALIAAVLLLLIAPRQAESAPAHSLVAAETLQLSFAGARGAFVRMEDNAQTRLHVINGSGQSASQLTVRIALQGRTRIVQLGELAAGARQTLDVEVDTRLRPDIYELQATLSGKLGAAPVSLSASRDVSLVSRVVPRMPVLMWGGGDVATLADIGFTHKLIWLADYDRIWQAGQPTLAAAPDRAAQTGAALDELLIQDLGGAVYLYPGRWVMRVDSLAAIYGRVDRAGNPQGHDNVCASFPRVQQFAYDVGASVAQTFGEYPALQAALIHSEIRDGTSLCFHDHDTTAYRAATGRSMPRDAVGKGGVQYSAIQGFPTDRVVPDHHPLLEFYRWFWKDGDGWNPLHTQVHRGLKSTGREDLWTFFDPAVRVPSVWGSGGDVDIVSQWTYSYPDPIKMGQAADELFAMAAGATTAQQVMKMTQIIWYRSQTAPDLPEDEATRAPWKRDLPDARFITISPDHLREAFWSKLSRPIRGIMYHGWGSLVSSQTGSYQFTNPHTRTALTQLIHDVVRPLGPTLLQVPDRPSDVAVLESFASQVFASRGTSGWSGSWEADMHLILQWAQLQPKIVFDETVVRDGLDAYQVLLMPCCDVLTEAVAAQIARFQRRGGIVIGDESLAPRVSPDILIESRKRTGRADADKAALLQKASELRAELDAFYTRYAQSADPEVIVRTRRYGDADYVFVLNDHRTYGDYVGHHGKVMEKGVAVTAEIHVRRQAAAVYDLAAHQPVPVRAQADAMAFDVQLGPGGGAVYLICDQHIDGVQVHAPERATAGERLQIEVTVIDPQGGPIAAVVPVRVDVTDPDGRAAEFSGYYGASDGRLSVTLDLAPNDLPGTWRIRVSELASGRSAERTFQLMD